MNKNIENAATSVKAKGYMLATALMLSPGFAIAGGGDFDGTAIVTKVTTYTAVGVLILGAFALGRWTLRALGLIGGK